MEPEVLPAVKEEPLEDDAVYYGSRCITPTNISASTYQPTTESREGCQVAVTEVKQEPVEWLLGSEPAEGNMKEQEVEENGTNTARSLDDSGAETQEPPVWPTVKIEIDVADTAFWGVPTEEHTWQADCASHHQPLCGSSNLPQDVASIKQEFPTPKPPLRIKLKTEAESSETDIQHMPWRANAETGQKTDALRFPGEQLISIKTEPGGSEPEYRQDVFNTGSGGETASSMELEALTVPYATGPFQTCADSSNNSGDEEEDADDDNDDGGGEEDELDDRDNVVPLPVHFHSGSGTVEGSCKTEGDALKLTEDVDSNFFQCGTCKQSYGDPTQLRQHMVNVHGCQVSARCALCIRMFKRVSYLVKHAKHHTALRQHQCSTCSLAFKCAAHLRRHQRSHSGEKPYTCSFCSAAFSHSTNLKDHIRTHTGEKPYSCALCPSAFKKSSTLKKHILSMHNSERSYRCKVCHKTFPGALELKDHKTIHKGEKTYFCDTCPAKFYSSSHLNGHKAIHSEEKPFTCGQCPATFKRSSHLKSHQRIHSGDKPFKCERCPKAFSDASNLKTHFRTHSGERPYKCEQCQATFTQSSSLKGHVRRHMRKNLANLCS